MKIASAPQTPLPSFPQQSPIHLEDPIHADLGDRGLQLDWADIGTLQCRAQDGDHGASVEVEGDSAAIHLDRQGFELKGFHFHTPSEHVVEGKRYPLELHLVHQNRENGKVAVLGVLVDTDSDPNQHHEPLHKFLREVKEALPNEGPVHVDPAILLPKFPSHYYRYEGSLTTPGYDSNVSWVVFKEPLRVCPDELAELSDVFEKEARDIQPLHRRFVLATFPPEIKTPVKAPAAPRKT